MGDTTLPAQPKPVQDRPLGENLHKDLHTGQCHVPRARLRRALLSDRLWRPEEAAAQEFREDGVGGAGTEKFRQARAERVRDHEC